MTTAKKPVGTLICLWKFNYAIRYFQTYQLQGRSNGRIKMKQELDKLLCERYPKMMVNRNKPMIETCMCWGFECGDGWFNILDQLMGNIQHHIDWKVKQREDAIKRNEMVQKLKDGDSTLFDEEYKDMIDQEYKAKRKQELINDHLRDVPDLITQVTLDQVKEKFGTLRFYYTGGDDVIDGMVRMAESMTEVTCEKCGNPGKTRGGGWVYTSCTPCEDMRQAELKKITEEYDLKKLLKEGNKQ